METIKILTVRVFTSKGDPIPSMTRQFGYDLLSDKEFKEAFMSASYYVAVVCENNPNYSCRIEK